MKKKWIIALTIIALVVTALLLFLNKRGQTDIIVDESIPRIIITSSSFEDLGVMHDIYTGRGEDISPAFELSGLMENAVSIAIIMDDLDVPWRSNFTHWVIWNIPVVAHIPERISHGRTVPELDGAVQGVAFGRNRYRGPMPPFGTHRYQFHVFVLDTSFDIDSSSGKSDLLTGMEGHIIQYGTFTGWYPRKSY